MKRDKKISWINDEKKTVKITAKKKSKGIDDIKEVEIDFLDEQKTQYIQEEISRCENINELKEKILPLLSTQQTRVSRKISGMIDKLGCSQEAFGEICGVSRPTVSKWCNGSIPKNREQFLKIGMAAGYNIEEMNIWLQRYGRYPGLYSKTLEDCVCMYVLSQENITNKIEKYNSILNSIKLNIIHDKEEEAENISTSKFDIKLSKVKSEEELENFIERNIALFSIAFNKFYSYALANIMANSAGSVNELSYGQGWSSSLIKVVSAIRQKKWYPTRNKIISLGLHLTMDHEQIDEMLSLAHMEPLCAKNLFESAIIFILEDASLHNLMDKNGENYDPDDLCRYAKKVLGKLNNNEIDLFISEISEISDEK